MAEENNTPELGGFEAVSSFLTGKPFESGLKGQGTADLNEPSLIDPSVVKGDSFKEEGEGNNNEPTGREGEGTEPIEVDPSELQNKGDGEGEGEGQSEEGEGEGTSSNVDNEDLSKFESDITEYLNEQFAEKLGWDISEEDSPSSIEEFIDFMNEIIKDASQPTFANDEMQALNEFVENGGSLRDFYKTVEEGKLSLDNVNIEDVFTQKQLVKEHFKNLGYKEDKINRIIKRSEESGTLEEEANDALELLKEYNEKNKAKLLEQQQKLSEQQKEQQQTFITSVQDSINDIDKSLGVKLSPKEKKDLENYILVADNNGMTQFQKEMLADFDKFVSTAYYRQTGGSLLTRTKKQGETNAVKNLHKKIKANQGDPAKTGQGQNSGQSSNGLSVLSSMLRG